MRPAVSANSGLPDYSRKSVSCSDSEIFATDIASTFLSFRSIARERVSALPISEDADSSFLFVASRTSPNFPNSFFTAPSKSQTFEVSF